VRLSSFGEIKNASILKKTKREISKNLATAKSSKRVRRLLVLEIKTESGLKTQREKDNE
jgi:hypothetical protein